MPARIITSRIFYFAIKQDQGDSQSVLDPAYLAKFLFARRPFFGWTFMAVKRLPFLSFFPFYFMNLLLNLRIFSVGLAYPLSESYQLLFGGLILDVLLLF